ncbi:hypothetical protein HY468_00310 [Candidatus Roizmanbacteria bacterium]|nr:hypothetical protein [Candidatus Roizmanbacteria bacterium]
MKQEASYFSPAYPSFSRNQQRQQLVSPDRVSWGIAHKPFDDYLNDFSKLPWEKASNVEHHLQRLSTFVDPVVIDLLTYPEALRELYQRLGEPEQFRGLSVGSNDPRSFKERIGDDLIGITHLAGDLASVRRISGKPNSWDQIRLWLGDRTADFILSRGFAGLDYIPDRPYYYHFAVRQLWSMLNPDGGMLLVQTPPVETLLQRGISMINWKLQLKDAGISMYFLGSYQSRDYRFSSREPVRYGILQLIKSADIPLPDVTQQ